MKKKKKNINEELTDLRVRNGILMKDNFDLKIDNNNKIKFIQGLQKTSESSDEPEVVEVVTQTILMNKTNSDNQCNACESSFVI